MNDSCDINDIKLYEKGKLYVSAIVPHLESIRRYSSFKSILVLKKSFFYYIDIGHIGNGTW